MDRYNIGDFCFEWDGGGYELSKGEFFEKFRTYSPEKMEKIRFCGEYEPLESYLINEKITENYSYEMFQINNEKLLIYHWAKCRFGFSVWPDRINCNDINKCYFNPKLKDNVPMSSDWFFGLSGLHKALLQKNAPILHASYIDVEGQAILFSAPSQTGKSTQARLWETYAKAEIINGDRVLLRKREDIWYAYGYPCCGSSKICINRKLPLRAIVILKKGNINQIETMSDSEKIRCLITGIEVYRWDMNDINQAMKIAEDIIKDVPIVQLTCRPDADAVYVLKKYLEARNE